MTQHGLRRVLVTRPREDHLTAGLAADCLHPVLIARLLQRSPLQTELSRTMHLAPWDRMPGPVRLALNALGQVLMMMGGKLTSPLSVSSDNQIRIATRIAQITFC